MGDRLRFVDRMDSRLCFKLNDNLRDRIKTFSQALKDLDDQWIKNKSDVRERVDSDSEKLLATLTLFLKGDIGKVYDEFELGIECFRSAVDNWTSESPDNHHPGMQLFIGSTEESVV
ncbi:hypothetical protein Q31b_38740 [Novipirellula aureliae]|uniref:Uncharacterized protein n=1 Tax=Novipirellula aureliae TaxID=2527966 RepID=A0A5C6DUR2_9BACT|nr:hypothetical protein [Novipirellula aureliae]TWU38796.1 hypothetical protein Q31b_38740 [Novipirellula aureliae]